MKKNIILITIIIVLSSHLNAMEPEAAPCLFKGMPAEILDLIASFLPFDVIESEEEFIKRTKEDFINPNNSFDKLLPAIINFINNKAVGAIIDSIIYSPNNATHAITYTINKIIVSKTDSVPQIQSYRLSIAKVKTNQELHDVCLVPNHITQHWYTDFAISSSGNILASLEYEDMTKDKTISPIDKVRYFINIQNLCTHITEYHDNFGGQKIAFNKQGTHLIMHDKVWHNKDDSITFTHKIIPLTTALDVQEKKTLPRYFTQKMVCKNLMLQLKNTPTSFDT